MHDSHSFQDSVEKGVQLIDIVDDTIQKIMEKIQADPDVLFRQRLIDIHGTKYSYGQLVFFIEQEEVTCGSFYDPLAYYLYSIPCYKSVISETPFDESEYKLLYHYSSCFPIFLIIYIYLELETSFGGLMKFSPGYIGNGITI